MFRYSTWDDLLPRPSEDGYNYTVTKTHCTKRAEWQFQIGKPAERLSPNYRLDCEFGTSLMIAWGSAESEPIYLCEEHGKEFGSSAKVCAGTSNLAKELAESQEREASAETGEIVDLKSVFSAPFEPEDSISDVHHERTKAAQSSAEQRTSIHHKMTELSARPLPEAHPYLLRGIAAGVLIATLATAFGFLFNTHRRELGAILIQWGERLEATPAAAASQPPEGPSTALAPLAPGPVPAVSPAAAPAAARPLSSTRLPAYTSTAPIAQKQAAGRPAGPGNDANVSVSQSQRYSDGISDTPSSGTTAPLLWTAVAKGNLAAELKLARLYLQGNGVGKSCEQARVLLQAASAKGYTQARKMLVVLDSNADTDC
jgi:hypothetical protein